MSSAPPRAEPRPASVEPVDTRRVLRLWLPLAASWFCMALELPLFTMAVARMADEDVNLAAYGGVVFPIALVVEAPIIMLLAASTALAKDRRAYAQLRRFMHASGLALTLLHVAVAFTPLFDIVVGTFFDVREDVHEAARVGLRIMTPWTWAIAYRRFQQGVLIRFDRTRAVALGTLVRLSSVGTVLLVGYHWGGARGIVVGTTAIAIGVSAEALFVRACVRPVLRERVPERVGGAEFSLRDFLAFYVPLALTPLLVLLAPPLGAAAMSRMPDDLVSLAAWPAVHGLVFMTRSVGMAFNEVVVSLVALPGAVRVLWRFAWQLGLVTMLLLLGLGLSPLGEFWFRRITDLNPAVYALAITATTLAVLMPGNQALQSFFQGVLVDAKRTGPITESVALYLVAAVLALVPGVLWGPVAGILWAVPSFALAGVLQTAWLAWRSRPLVRALREEDAARANPSARPA